MLRLLVGDNMEDTACPYKEGNLVLMESMWGVEKAELIHVLRITVR